MDQKRRKALKAGAGIGTLGALIAAGLIRPGDALAQDWKAAFETKSLADTIKVLGGAHEIDLVGCCVHERRDDHDVRTMRRKELRQAPADWNRRLQRGQDSIRPLQPHVVE